MKSFASVFVCMMICAVSVSPSLAWGGSDDVSWGSPVDGVQISLSRTDPQSSGLQLAFRNVGDHDVNLNLGSMLANGQVQLPDRIMIEVRDVTGNERQFRFQDPTHPGVAGRLDDYIVPLRVGSTYTLALALQQFWCPETKEFGIPWAAGENRLTVTYTGAGSRLTNPDAAVRTTFWLGKATSNTLVIAK